MASSIIPKSILVISTSKFICNIPITTGIAKNWTRSSAQDITPHFVNTCFDLDPKASDVFKLLKTELEMKKWDGVIVGWCIRGNVEHTELFEKVVQMCYGADGRKLMFSKGPDDLVNTVRRNFVGPRAEVA